jgi:nitrite reductase/ring-hydroxylating ferredoxin subunit
MLALTPPETPMSRYVKVATLAQLPPGAALEAQADGQPLALFHTAQGLRAVEAECSHAGGPLCEAELDGEVVTCPWHAATFDLASGKALSLPATLDLRTFPVRVEGDDVLVGLD